MRNATPSLARWLLSLALASLLIYTSYAQSKNPALDSMGANMGPCYHID
jgi:hypothetical protein